MKLIKIILSLSLLMFFVSTVNAQVEKTAKETKLKVEKTVNKEIAKVKSKSKEACGADCEKACCSAEAKVEKAGKACDADCKKACCSAEAKVMKEGKSKSGECCSTEHAEMKKAEKTMKKVKAPGADCSCAGCEKA